MTRYEYDPDTDPYTVDYLNGCDCDYCDGEGCDYCDPDYIGDADYGMDD